MRKAGGRVVLVAGLLALLFGVIRGYEISVHVEVEQHNSEQPKFVSHRELPSKEGKKAAESGFDFFVLSQIWPGSYCKRDGVCCDDVEEPARFVVRGFWPDYSDYSYDSCCSGAPSFNASIIENGAGASFLKRYWPQLTCTIGQCNGENADTDWQYQWERSGTCAYPTIPDSTTYFMEGLKVSVQYDLLLYFQLVGGIVPDNTKTYKSSKAVKLVKGWVGSTPRLLCDDNKLYDIWICLSKDLKFQDCPSGSPNSCPEEFLFPPFEKQATPHLWNVS